MAPRYTPLRVLYRFLRYDMRAIDFPSAEKEAEKFVSALVAEEPRWRCEDVARSAFGDQLVDFAMKREGVAYIIWNSLPDDMSFHNQWRVSISVPQLPQSILRQRVYDFAHEIGHLIPRGWPMWVNAYCFSHSLTSKNEWWSKWWSRLSIPTEILASVMGYWVLTKCGLPITYWREHLWGTIKFYWRGGAGWKIFREAQKHARG